MSAGLDATPVVYGSIFFLFSVYTYLDMLLLVDTHNNDILRFIAYFSPRLPPCCLSVCSSQQFLERFEYSRLKLAVKLSYFEFKLRQRGISLDLSQKKGKLSPIFGKY